MISPFSATLAALPNGENASKKCAFVPARRASRMIIECMAPQDCHPDEADDPNDLDGVFGVRTVRAIRFRNRP